MDLFLSDFDFHHNSINADLFLLTATDSTFKVPDRTKEDEHKFPSKQFSTSESPLSDLCTDGNQLNLVFRSRDGLIP